MNIGWNMYFWKIDELVEDFRSNNVSQKEEFKYFITFSIISVIMSDKYFSLGGNYNLYDFLDTVSLIAVSLWGIWHCYKINSTGDNSDFITRMICIGFPAALRVLAIVVPIMFLVGFIQVYFLEEAGLDESLYEDTTVSDVLMIALIGLTYYFYLATKIKAVSIKTP